MLSKRVKNLERAQEVKFYQTGLTETTITSSSDWAGTEYDPSATSMISTPAVGDAANSRDGKKITVNSVTVKGYIQWDDQINQTAPDIMGPVFIALVQDNQTNGAQLNGEDVFTNVPALSGLPPLRNQNFRKRFRVLRFKTIIPPMPSMTWDGTNIEQSGKIIPFTFYHRFKSPLIVNFNLGTTASVASVLDKSFHILCNGAVSEATAKIAYNAEILFSDS